MAPRSTSSPKKKARCRADSNIEGTAITVQKRRRNDHELPEDPASQVLFVDNTSRRRSGRSGAGSGGHIFQLERVGSVLEATVKNSRKATNLPEDAVENPLAPEKSQKKGRATRKKDLPPPYSSELAPAPVPAPVPVFHQCASDSDRFGFHASPSQPPPIVPPGTEPDLHALNNPYVAAARKVSDSASSRRPSYSEMTPVPCVPRPLSRQPSMLVIPKILDNKTSESQLLYGNSGAIRRAPEDIRDYQIDPALLNSQTRISKVNHDSQTTTEESSSDTGHSDHSKGSIDGEHNGEDEVEVDGWGTTNQRRTTHPGFAREHHSLDPIRHNSLPPEPEFQYSRDEDDDAALHALQRPNGRPLTLLQSNSARDSQLEGLQEPVNVLATTSVDATDILDRHHQINGRPSAPNPARLAALSQNVNNESQVQTVHANVVEPRSRAPRNSKKSKDSPVSPDTLAYYPPVWKDFLEDAKRDCRISHSNNNPFPSKSRDLKGSVSESLVTSLVESTQRGTKFEDGYWPENKTDMASLLLADISTWRSELKTVALNAAPAAYGLTPPSDVPAPGQVQWVRTTATELLEESLFLRGGLDDNGKTRNFAHPALQQAITEFYYLGSYRIADKRPDLFQQSVPISCLALTATAYNCVLDGFAQNGSTKSMPHFSGKSYSSIYQGMLSVLDGVLRHPYHGPRLTDQLSRWGREAWALLRQSDSDVQRHEHLVVVLD